MVNIECASVFFGRRATVLAHLVAFPDFLSNLLPRGVINWIGVFAKILADKVIDLVAAITFVTARNRAVFSRHFLDGPLAYFARLTRKSSHLALMSREAGTRAKLWLVSTIRSTVKLLAAKEARIHLSPRFPVALTRAKLYLLFPVFRGSSLLFVEYFSTLEALFRGLVHSEDYTLTSATYQGCS